jgi:hypothetical protein
MEEEFAQCIGRWDVILAGVQVVPSTPYSFFAWFIRYWGLFQAPDHLVEIPAGLVEQPGTLSL